MEAERRERVGVEVASLEALCARIERALTARDWSAFARAMSEARRVTHALQNAWELPGERAGEFDRSILARVRRIYTIRENQLARLRSYHESLGERLRTISRFRGYARSIGGTPAQAGSGALDCRR